MAALKDRNFKTVITIFHVFKKAKESTNMLRRNMEDIKGFKSNF